MNESTHQQVIVEPRGILNVTEGILVHGCNARGVMGSGVAAAIRKRWPAAWQIYRKTYETQGLHLGDVIFAKINERLYIADAITQQDYGRDPHKVYVSEDAVKQCFETIREMAKSKNLPVHFPRIGAGLAHGNWGSLYPLICNTLGDDVDYTLWELPGETAAPSLPHPVMVG